MATFNSKLIVYQRAMLTAWIDCLNMNGCRHTLASRYSAATWWYISIYNIYIYTSNRFNHFDLPLWWMMTLYRHVLEKIHGCQAMLTGPFGWSWCNLAALMLTWGGRYNIAWGGRYKLGSEPHQIRLTNLVIVPIIIGNVRFGNWTKPYQMVKNIPTLPID